MMRDSSTRMMHSAVCLVAFAIWFFSSWFIWLIPGMMSLYRSGLAMSFMHAVILLPGALLLWKVYSSHYPLLYLGKFSLREFIAPLLALTALMVIYGHFSEPETWTETLSTQTLFVKWMTAISVCICAPISEEIIFRGLVLNSSIGWGKAAKFLGIVGTSLLFSAIHVQYHSMISFIYLFIFSAILCAVRINNRGLIMPMALHALNNSWAMLALFL